MPRIAGSRVRETSTATKTVAAAARPMVARNGMPTTASDRAMSTVRPAKTTAEPAVPTATPTACERSSVVRTGAVAGQDEQRVVDADRQTQHRGQDRGGGVDAEHGGHRGDAGQAEAHAEDGVEERHAGGEPKVSTRTTSATARPITSRSPRGSRRRWHRDRWPRPRGGRARLGHHVPSLEVCPRGRRESMSHSKVMMPVRPSSLSGEIAAALASACSTLPAPRPRWRRSAARRS